MPTRLLRDGILTSERVNALSPGAELFYRRLMSVVDDHGRFFADTRLLTSGCYPLTFDRTSPTIVRQWLAECSEGHDSLLNVYEVDGKRYLEIKDFRQRTRSDSKFPPPSAGTRPSSADNCPQPADNCGSRARDPEAKTEAKTETGACAGEPGSPLDPMVATDAVSRNVSGSEIERSTKRRETGLKPGAVGDDFTEFQTACVEVGLPFSDYDLNEARMEWRSLDFEQRLRCVAWLRSSPFDGDPKFRPLPQNVLRKRIWARAVPATKAPELPLVHAPKGFME